MSTGVPVLLIYVWTYTKCGKPDGLIDCAIGQNGISL